MNEAKQAVKDFMSKSGHHDTTVHEKVAPAVTNETVHQHKHNQITTAIDKEIHQDHYHTSVQPVKDEQRLNEQHHHNLAAVDHRHFSHGKDEDVKMRLEQEAAKFRDSRQKGEVRETESVAPTVAGEHIHHHVHETIQPVVQRETIEPHVVHTTVPIHEVHENAAQHHSTSALPAVSMRDFKAQGGSLTGREERNDGFEGEPRAVGSALSGSGHGHHHGHHSGTESGMTGSNTTGSGLTGNSTTGSGLTGNNTTGSSFGTTNRDEYPSNTGSGLTGSHAGTGSGMTGRDSSGIPGTHRDNVGNDTGLGGRTGTDSSYADSQQKKPSLLSRMNPMKDSDGDGKKGMMD